ncbi:hypothetical protein [Winogradskyella luteola]|uniref:NTR domain-containing protein n=1 Tax=Winogradskyella luteola TaxID=2828330 RepID=A0A9X1FCS9_9FLAO|nr:hypothetical protein [Winogradskyella luteola]MBV7270718.1 hypothetical protein [Winogradskyella luteola]
MKRTFILILVLIFSITETFACSCIQTNEPLSKKVEKAFAQSDLIISGKVVEIKIVNKARMKSSADPIIYKFEITKTLKGKIEKEFIEIASETSGASCGYKFELGKSYLVYARKSTHFAKMTKNKFDFVTGLCDRNQKLNKVDKKELRKLKKLNCRSEK